MLPEEEEAERGQDRQRRHSSTGVAMTLAAILVTLGAILTCASAQKPLLTGGVRKRDIYVAGLFPYATHVPESIVGRGVMPSVKLAVEHVNENPNILRNYRLQVLWNDTQCNAAVGVKAFFDMMHSSPHKVMLFGAACTQVTDPIAKASKHWRLTQLSYADTHPMFTSDSFPNFFRIVPSENAFNAPRLALLAHFNWTRVGTLYQNEPRFALAHNRLISDLDLKGVEVVESQSFATEVTTALEKLRDKDVRIILGNFNEVWAMKIFCEAHRLNMFGRRYQWVIVGMYKEMWWQQQGMCAPVKLQEALQGTILTDLLPLSTEQQITVSGITPDEYQVEYDLKRKEEDPYVYSRFHGYTYDGIWAMALAIQHVARRIRHFRRNQTIADFRYRDDLWEKLFLEALRNTSFEGVTGPVRFYDNERKAYILLKQFQSGEEVKVGEYDAITGALDLSRGSSLFWHGNSPPKDRTLHIIEQSTVNITIYAILATAASCGIVMAAVFLAINIRYRNQRYIKMSSPHLNNLIIIGCMLTYSSVIFLGLDSQLSSVQAFPYICTARAWLLMAGFSLAFGSMFSKTWRVHSIFTDVKLNKKVIKDYQLFMVVGVLLFIDLAIMTTWQIADPFYRETKQMEPYIHPSSQDIIILPENEYCQSNRMTIYLGSIYAYKGLLMIFGAFLAWETRHVSIPALNDSKYVGMSVYNVVIMCITGAAISFVLADKQDAMFIMLSIFIIFCSTATLCLVFVPKLIELRRNPQGQIDKRFRPTLRPMSKTRRDSTVSEMEDRIKDMTVSNQKFRKLLHEKENELQLYLRRLADENIMGTQYMRGLGDDDVHTRTDRLTVPRHEATIKREGPSVTTETTDISVSMCSLNSTTNVSQLEGDYVNVNSLEQQVAKKKTSFSKTLIVSDSDRAPVMTTSSAGVMLQSALKHPSGEGGIRVSGDARRRARIVTEDHQHRLGADYVEESHSNDEDEPPRVPRRSRLPTPPPPKNVSFGELREDSYLEQQSILPPPVQFVPKHRHAGPGSGIGSTAVPHQAPTKRRSSVKSGGEAHSHQELFEKRRPSVPAATTTTTNSISYISSENVRSSGEEYGESCGHHLHKQRSPAAGTGYRCEKHGGGAGGVGRSHHHSHAMLNGSSSTTAERDAASYRRHKYHCDSHNVSSPSVAAPSYSDAERYDDSGMHRTVSERARGVGPRGGRHTHQISECPHRRRPSRECHRHGLVDSKLRQQASRLEYVQSTPDVATIHNSKFGSANPRMSAAAAANGGVATVSTANLSKMYPDGEHQDIAILPIFQKLLTERHKTASRYGASVASCPNISIKCDIVEYL